MSHSLDIALKKLKEMSRDELLLRLKKHEIAFIDNSKPNGLNKSNNFKEAGVVLISFSTPLVRDFHQEFYVNNQWPQFAEAA
ncbi:hypothetical protein [Rivihabitans pingtungensis]|uniref:Uncharacterized protein n=1 Tax=Rivihabitans pingtungensis TaxID=1054498 RepID=A0A318KWA5_9NEIS|nr:hypothetical protein [Rivihabitans pingtungensis]PXX81859.1 hypothetical protein DFR34_10188 [Rivihabitans pingtungensis]